MPLVLAISGSDPTGGAGLQADLQVLRRLGVHGAGVPTALTVQDTHKVHQVLPVFPSVVLAQLRAVLRDLRPDAVKIGMLASDDVLRNVRLGLEELPPEVPIVLDPVLHASDGSPLLERRAWGALRELVGRCVLVTPNLPEAEALTGRDVSSRAGTEAAARALVEELGAQAALVKGGHREGAPDDLLAVREGTSLRIDWLPGTRIETGPVKGTGCALASAIAAHLARGSALRESVEASRSFLAQALAASQAFGSGARFLVYP